MILQGRIQDFQTEGRKDYARSAHPEREARSPSRQRSVALKRLVFDALSCYLCLVLKHSDTKLNLKNIGDQN